METATKVASITIMETVHIIWGELAVSLYRQRIIDNSVRLAHGAYDFRTEIEAQAFLYGISEARKENMYAQVTSLPDIRALGMPLRARIVDAVKNGDVKTVEEMLDAGVDPNTKGPNGMSLLEISADNGSDDVAEKLLQRGARPEESENSAFSALHLGAASFHPGAGRVVDLITDRQMDINRPDESGKSALIKAIESSRLETALILIDKGAKVNIVDNNGMTARDHFDKKFGGVVNDPLKDKFDDVLGAAEKEDIENTRRLTAFIHNNNMRPTPFGR